MSTTIAKALSWGQNQINQSVVWQGMGYQPDGALEARWLLQAVLDCGSGYLLAWPEKPLASEQYARFQHMIHRRCQGEPMAYILGEVEFYGLTLTVTDKTLVPRADTETLVDWCIQHLPISAQVLDLGTGSGAIALALAQQGFSVTATDQSEDALQVARCNAQRLGLTVDFHQGNWFEALRNDTEQSPFDAVVSNPPYLADDDRHLPSLKYEPLSALVAADQGLADIAQIVAGAPTWLKSQGWCVIEHGFEQGEAVRHLFFQAGATQVQTLCDLAQNPRITLGQFNQDCQNGAGI